MTSPWRAIWGRRVIETPAAPTLSDLLALDGMGSGFGAIEEGAWRAFVTRVAGRIGLRRGEEVFEVGCGAGAFLRPLADLGARVGGLDFAANLLAVARHALPGGRFVEGEAAELPAAPAVEHVVSMGVFLYFPSEAYAERVLERACALAGRTLTLLDLPDRAHEARAIEARRRYLGEEVYARDYADLEHRYYDRGWVRARLEAAGFEAHAEDQDIAGYYHAPYRFNVFAGRRG